LYTRRGLDWTSRFPEIAEALEELDATGTIDGEVVVLRPDGISDFARLQARLAGEKDYELSFFVFDILGLEGKDLRDTPLMERKSKLKKYLEPLKNTGKIFYTDHVEGSGSIFFEQGCSAGLEGIIAKPAASLYRSGRVGEWLKIKCGHRQEFVIGGYVPPTTGIKGIGSLAVGYHRDGKLIYGGRIGTGYTDTISRDLRQRLDKLKQKECPFAGPLSSEARRNAVWVKPELVAEISYGTLTPDGIVRHGAFKGLREDKTATEVTLEMTKPAKAKSVKSAVHSGREADEVAGIRISHPDKVLDPESGLTKLRLAEYYDRISDWIMPHLENRPLSIVRCPEGDTKPCFYQRHIAIGLPADVYPVEIDGEEGHERYLSIKNKKGLISLVQIGALEIHPWGAPNKAIEKPDRMIFDLDPDPSVGWEEVVKTAFLVRDRLADMNLKSFVKTTGGKGLHVVLPLSGKQDWPAIKTFAKKFAGALVDEFPKRYIAVMSKKDRAGKIFIDYLRNDRTATAVVAYSTRARAGAPVATPLDWRELTPEIDPKTFTIDSVKARLKTLKNDPWKGFFEVKQSIPA
jgi:bifunctional non-homologous end joining protein LigD